MILGGDEFGCIQGGNNNVYCQDNDISWYDWEKVDEELFVFIWKLIVLCKVYFSLYCCKFFVGCNICGEDVCDIVWLCFDGVEMSDEDWNNF